MRTIIFGLTIAMHFFGSIFFAFAQENECIYHVSFGNMQAYYGYFLDTIVMFDFEGNYVRDTILYGLDWHSDGIQRIIADDTSLSKPLIVTTCNENKRFAVIRADFSLKTNWSAEPVNLVMKQNTFDSATISIIKKSWSDSEGDISIVISDSGKEVRLPGCHIDLDPPLHGELFNVSFYQWHWNGFHSMDTFPIFNSEGFLIADTIIESTGYDVNSLTMHCKTKPSLNNAQLEVISVNGTGKYVVKEFLITHFTKSDKGPFLESTLPILECSGGFLTPEAKSVFKNCKENEEILISEIKVEDIVSKMKFQLTSINIYCVK